MKEAQLQIVLPLLPEHLHQAVDRWRREHCEEMEELRLRIGQRLLLLHAGGETLLPTAAICSRDLEILLERATEFSPYRCAESIRNGFLTVRGGCRIGICGTVILREGEIATIQDLSSLSIRVAGELPGVAAEIYPQLWQRGRFESTLLVAPPGGGKTTLLRDLIRCLSNGAQGHGPLRVCVADERGEIAAAYRGAFQFDLGTHTDVLTGGAKRDTILMLLRSMNPQVIALDEITDPVDIQAITVAGNCGVAFLATMHGANLAELADKPVFFALRQCGIFSQYLLGNISEGRRIWRLERF